MTTDIDLTIFDDFPVAKLKTMTKAVDQINKWYDGQYMSKPGTGTTVKAAVGIRDFSMAMTCMVWLNKYLTKCDNSVFKKVYRVHDASKEQEVPVVGKSFTLKPFKPMLSWTNNEKPRVAERKPRAGDVVFELKNPKVIWSVLDLLVISKNKSRIRKEFEKQMRLHPESPHVKLMYSLLSLSCKYENYSAEQEVVVYHGTKNFKAKVVIIPNKK